MKQLLHIALCNLFLTAIAPPAAAQPAGGEDVQFRRGAEVYQHYCARCHGKDADGEGLMVKRLYRRIQTQLPSNFTLGMYAERTAEYLRTIITEGGEPHSMSKYMPPFGEELSVADIEDLIHFIRQTPPLHGYVKKP